MHLVLLKDPFLTICRIPEINALPAGVQLVDSIDPTSMINSGLLSIKTYCRMLKLLPNICWSRSVLELWDFDLDNSLPPGNSTLEQVLEELNAEEVSRR